MFRVASGTRTKAISTRIASLSRKSRHFRRSPVQQGRGFTLFAIGRCAALPVEGAMRSFAIVAARTTGLPMSRNCSMRKLVLGLLLAWLVRLLRAPHPPPRLYISDQFTVPLRRGPSNSHRILHAGLPSGTALEVLGEDKRRRFHAGAHGKRHGRLGPDAVSVRQPSRADQLAAATRRVESLEAQLKIVREDFQRRDARSEANAAPAIWQADRKLQTELTEIRRVSATSIANYEENKQLKSEQPVAAEAGHAAHRTRAPARAQRHAALVAGRRRAWCCSDCCSAPGSSRDPKRSTWA